ncbi:MAG: restriction endonuclease subunit S [Kiritimatiellae bacterium]|jgi:type I restriction enzyme S subunit|nr:restriction endonuclease subunit S [Kiritimatiellia bacterium]
MKDPNENKAGYKKTKVGWIPEEWDNALLAKHVSINHGWAFESEFFATAGKYILLTPGNFNEEGGFRLRPGIDRSYSGDFPDRYLLKNGDMLVAMTEQAAGLLGSAAFVPENNKYLHNQRLGLVTVLPSSTSLAIHFLYYVLNATRARRYISITAAGTKVRHTSPGRILAHRVAFPPLPEQQKIVEILSTWDEAIEQTRKLIDLKQKRFNALMRKLISDNSQLETAKTGWRVVKLGDVFEEVTDKVGDKELEPYSISAGVGFISQREKWGKNISGAQHKNYTHLRASQFAYNKGNSKRYKQGCAYLLRKGEICVPNVFICFRPKSPNVNPEFYQFYFQGNYHAHDLQRVITSGARSDGLLNLNKKDFFKIGVPLPPTEDQKQIAEVLNAAQKEIDLLKKMADKYKTQKRGLMQKLMTGEWRVPCGTNVEV